MADPNMLFNLTLKNADIREALQDFFREAGSAFSIDAELDGTISVHAADLEFREALALMLPEGYGAEEVDGVFHIIRSRK
ncbi:MAG: hypothetical protein ACYDBB_00565 [Armatimonadota bacterium]